MPWRESTPVSERFKLVGYLGREDVSKAAAARAYCVSRKTLYKWLRRYEEGGQQALTDHSRRPLNSPRRVSQDIEEAVCAVRLEHSSWGGRKIRHKLLNDGHQAVPAASTITGILRRRGLLSPNRRLVRDWVRFEEQEPNDLWQMDFKGHFPTGEGRCHPLTILDDHSRFNLCLAACADEQAQTVQLQLSRVFDEYGLPKRMLMDNGPPWGSDQAHPHTRLTAGFIRLGITVIHCRPYHPQTQGKEERFHRTLKAEVLRCHDDWPGLREVQAAFDSWREVYNRQRPHEALGNAPPSSRYRESPRRPPARLEPIEYMRGDIVRRVQDKGRISFQGRNFRISRAFVGEPVALRATEEGVWDVYYCHQKVGEVRTTPPPGSDL